MNPLEAFIMDNTTRFCHTPTWGCLQLPHTSPSAQMRAQMKEHLVLLFSQGPEAWNRLDMVNEDPQQPRFGASPMQYLLDSGLPHFQTNLTAHRVCQHPGCAAKEIGYSVVFTCSLTPPEPAPLSDQQTEHGAWRIKVDGWMVVNQTHPLAVLQVHYPGYPTFLG